MVFFKQLFCLHDWYRLSTSPHLTFGNGADVRYTIDPEICPKCNKFRFVCDRGLEFYKSNLSVIVQKEEVEK